MVMSITHDKKAKWWYSLMKLNPEPKCINYAVHKLWDFQIENST